ncbi:hypothetical protein BKA70DRAFT_639415 [Coprinopsis sp. MPI-PUGE-AT-0042]|nr:hypothetical protein BKA70DRAFT_639415 [Coprinopsis sp. MPI-PUGE-AT-0042]
MARADDDLESAHSVHIGFGSEEKDASNDPRSISKGTESTLDDANEKEGTKESTPGPVSIAVVKQPEPIPEPVTKPEAAPLAARPSRRPAAWRGPFRVILTILLGLGRVFVILAMGIGILALFALFAAIGFGVAAANGALLVVVGNAVMYKAGGEASGYTSEHSKAAAIGAVGGILATMIVGVVTSFIPRKSVNGQQPQHPWYIQVASTVLGGTLSGAIGSAILIRNNVDLAGLDILHATRAGAVGGAIFGPGAIILLPLIIIVIGIILAPLWLAMSLGLEFVYSKSRESWTENSYRYSGCHCWGTCGDGDPEIQSEILRLQQRQNAL